MTEETPVPSRVIEAIYEDLRDEYQIDIATTSKKSVLDLIAKEQSKLERLIKEATNIRTLHKLSTEKTKLKISKTLLSNYYPDFAKHLSPLSKTIQYQRQGKTVFRSHRKWSQEEVQLFKSIIKENPNLIHKPSRLFKKYNNASPTPRSYRSLYYKLRKISTS